MTKLGVAMGGNPETFPGLAGLGDLIVTCTSSSSRNRHVGEEIGKGKTIDEIITSMNQVAEGVKASSVVMTLADEYGIQMPIAREVDGVINQGSTVEQAYRGSWPRRPGTKCTAPDSDQAGRYSGFTTSRSSESAIRLCMGPSAYAATR